MVRLGLHDKADRDTDRQAQVLYVPSSPDQAGFQGLTPFWQRAAALSPTSAGWSRRPLMGTPLTSLTLPPAPEC